MTKARRMEGGEKVKRVRGVEKVDKVEKREKVERVKVKRIGKEKCKDEIDELFSQAEEQKTAKREAPGVLAVQNRLSKKEDLALFGDPKGELTEGATRRFTEDGLPIYLWAEIISPGDGDGPDCPFDCQCCY